MGVFAMMLLHVHVAIAAANLAEDKCAPLRAQNAQLVAQLAHTPLESRVPSIVPPEIVLRDQTYLSLYE